MAGAVNRPTESRWDPFRLKAEIRRWGVAILTALQELRDIMAAGQAEIEAEIQALKASEQARNQREQANADRLQAAIDDLKAHPAAPDMQAQLDELLAIQADMDAAAQLAVPAPGDGGPAPSGGTVMPNEGGAP